MHLPAQNRCIRLKKRPEGMPGPHHFTVEHEAKPSIADNQALVHNLFVSVDPTQRIWMTEMEQYMPPVALGEVMRAGGLGEVVQSNHPRFEVGQRVVGNVGWQDYSVIDAEAQGFAAVPQLDRVPPEAFLGVLGATGATAYFGLTELGRPQAKETLVVSAAAGAVGSIVGQIGRLHGCRVVGLAGSPRKCAWLKDELQFDAAINYKDADWEAQLDRSCPDGIDINFENVGGPQMGAVLRRMNLHGRVVLCGLISGYNKPDGTLGDFGTVLMRRLQVQGFIILDYLPRLGEAVQKLSGWLAEGKLKDRQTVVRGLERCPDALRMLFDGDNIGKLLVAVD